jgi:type IV fimbrial biogenesis protein FimT
MPYFGLQNHGAGRGFTLIELLVTIAVAGILIAIGVPAFNSFVLNDRDSAQANSLVYSLNYARGEAIKLNSGGATVCPSSDGQTCNATSNWGGGWIVSETLPGQAATVLQAVPALSASTTLTAGGTGQTGLQFLSNGQVSGQTTLQITICDSRGAAFARDVEVNATGRVAASQIVGQSLNRNALSCP